MWKKFEWMNGIRTNVRVKGSNSAKAKRTRKDTIQLNEKLPEKTTNSLKKTRTLSI